MVTYLIGQGDQSQGGHRSQRSKRREGSQACNAPGEDNDCSRCLCMLPETKACRSECRHERVTLCIPELQAPSWQQHGVALDRMLYRKL